jgi:AhpD family alkylhydroperoxidase
LTFEKDVFHATNAIPLKMKELIAIAIAHVTGCPYCIDVHVKKCKALGGTQEEMLEAIMIAASTRAGAILSHATHALISFEEQSHPPTHKSTDSSSSAPDCFC